MIKVFWRENRPVKVVDGNYVLFDYDPTWVQQCNIKLRTVKTPDDWAEILLHVAALDLRLPMDFFFDYGYGVGFWWEEVNANYWELNIITDGNQKIENIYL